MKRHCDQCGARLAGRRGHGFPYRTVVICGGCEIARQKAQQPSRPGDRDTRRQRERKRSA